MIANHVFWRLMLFYTHLLLLLQPSVWWLGFLLLTLIMMQSHRQILREFDVSRIGPRLAGLLLLETFTWQNLTGWEGYPVCQTGLPAFAGHPIYHVNVITLEWEIIWTGRLPLLKRVTSSPTWGAPPSCKQALNKAFCLIVTINVLYDTKRLQVKNGL